MARGKTIAVFGSSEPAPGSEPYEVARRLGRLLAEAGHLLITGGYGGVMEAASRGAREASGRSIGVTCEIFDARAANRYLSETISTADLYERTRRLIEPADAYVVLGGRAGTLAELTMLWALERAGCLGRRPVLLLGEPWPALLEALSRAEMLERSQLGITRLVATPEEACRALVAALGTGG